MLLGDGSPTRHLRLLTGHPVAVRLVAMEAEPEPPGTSPSRLPQEVRELEPPLLRRQVWLDCGGQTLAWAESWWNQSEAEQHLHDRNLPISVSYTHLRAHETPEHLVCRLLL